MQAYCVNLDRRADRREEAQLEFDREGLSVDFFSATDGRVEAPSGLYITPAEYGCATSHVRIWKDMVARGHKMALVIEDDVRLVPNFNSKLESILKEVEGHKWDIINLGPIVPIVRHPLTPNLYEGQPLGTHAYVINLECAKKISVFDPEFMKVGIDYQLNRFPIRILCVWEPIAKQEDIDSSIFTGLIKSSMKGDIGLERTLDYMYLFKLGCQRFKVFIIMFFVALVAYMAK